jgi:hypothetical protein
VRVIAPFAFAQPGGPGGTRRGGSRGALRRRVGEEALQPFEAGHSRLIVRLLARIQATFEVEISIRTVFSMSTLEVMAHPVAGA